MSTEEQENRKSNKDVGVGKTLISDNISDK